MSHVFSRTSVLPSALTAAHPLAAATLLATVSLPTATLLAVAALSAPILNAAAAIPHGKSTQLVLTAETLLNYALTAAIHLTSSLLSVSLMNACPLALSLLTACLSSSLSSPRRNRPQLLSSTPLAQLHLPLHHWPQLSWTRIC